MDSGRRADLNALDARAHSQALEEAMKLLRVSAASERLARQQADEENLIDADEFIRQLQAGPPVGSR